MATLPCPPRRPRRPSVPWWTAPTRRPTSCERELDQLLEEDRQRAAESAEEPVGPPAARPDGSATGASDGMARIRDGAVTRVQHQVERARTAVPETASTVTRTVQEKASALGGDRRGAAEGRVRARHRAGAARHARRGGRGAGPGPARPAGAEGEMTHADPASAAPVLPGSVRPMLAMPGALPTSSGWAFEFKWDGVRAVVAAAARPGAADQPQRQRLTGDYPEMARRAPGRPPVLLDGEIVALDRNGRPDFGLLQQRMHVRAPAASCGSGYRSALRLRRAGRRRAGCWPSRSTTAASAWSDSAWTGARGRGAAVVHRRDGASCWRWPVDTAWKGSSPSAGHLRYEPGRRSAAWVKAALLTPRRSWSAAGRPGRGGGRRRSARCCSVHTTRRPAALPGQRRHRVHRQMLHDLFGRLRPCAGTAARSTSRSRASTPAASGGCGRSWWARCSTGRSPRTAGCGTPRGAGCVRTGMPTRCCSTVPDDQPGSSGAAVGARSRPSCWARSTALSRSRTPSLV